MESHLRLRGIPENKDENIFEVVVDKLANFLGEHSEDFNYNFEAIYRVNSSYMTQNQLPRDFVVQIIKSYREPLLINGKSIKILKELPGKVIYSRRAYRQLSEKLKNFKVRF